MKDSSTLCRPCPLSQIVLVMSSSMSFFDVSLDQRLAWLGLSKYTRGRNDQDTRTALHTLKLSYGKYFLNMVRSDIKSSGKFAIFRRLKIDPETPPLPYL